MRFRSAEHHSLQAGVPVFTRRLVLCRVKVIFLAWDGAGWRCYTPRMLPTHIDEAEVQWRLGATLTIGCDMQPPYFLQPVSPFGQCS
jgi:hypothetical protein